MNKKTMRLRIATYAQKRAVVYRGGLIEHTPVGAKNVNVPILRPFTDEVNVLTGYMIYHYCEI